MGKVYPAAARPDLCYPGDSRGLKRIATPNTPTAVKPGDTAHVVRKHGTRQTIGHSRRGNLLLKINALNMKKEVTPGQQVISRDPFPASQKIYVPGELHPIQVAM